MQNEGYTTEYTVEVPAERVFRAITDVRGYWSPRTTGDAAQKGDEFVYCDDDLMSHFRVSEVVPHRRIVWDVVESRTTFVEDPAEWDDTRVIFELAPEGAGTRLRFTHEGLSTAKECYAEWSTGWSGVIDDSLKHLITTGRSVFDE